MSDKCRVIKNLSGYYTVDNGQETIIVSARKKNKNSSILVGDYVKVEGGVIESIFERTNRLIRPAIANVDRIIITVAPFPKPDFYLIDKMIVNCRAQKIQCILCMNKDDENDEGLFDNLNGQYGNWADGVIKVSAVRNQIERLIPFLTSGLSCFAGQSAVGKSSICNSILGGNFIKTDSVSQKINRGKNTTTAAEIFKSPFGGYIADTPGFGLLDIFDVGYNQLPLYYPEYIEIACNCRFKGQCTHTVEPDCAVKAEVGKSLDKSKYERYLINMENLKKRKTNGGIYE